MFSEDYSSEGPSVLPCPLKTSLGHGDASLGRHVEWVGAGTCLPKSAAVIYIHTGPL